MTTKTAAITTGALTVIAMAALTVAPAHAASVCDDKVHLLTTGTSTAFETNGRWVLVGGDRAAYDYLTSRGVKKLDAYVAPSANPDVISAAPGIVAGFKPDAVWTPAYDELRAGGRTAGADDAYRRLSDAALAANRSYGAKTVTGADSGTQFTVGDIQFTLYRSTDATPDTVGGGGCRVDTLLWACYCWCCQRDALGFVLACSVEFIPVVQLARQQILALLIQVRALSGMR